MNASNKTNSIQVIKEALIKACINSRPCYFKPFLSSDKVTTEWPDKKSFYEFFEYMLTRTRYISTGELHLKIKFPDTENKSLQHYKFYDKIHLHARLTIFVDESKDSIHLNIAPF